MTKIQVAIVGTNMLSRLHAENIMKHVNNMQLRMLLKSEWVDEQQELFQNVTVTDCVEDIFTSKTIDAIIICSSSHLRLGLIEKAIQSGKHIYSEYPVREDVNAIQRLIDSLALKDIHCQVDMPRRFEPACTELKQQIDNGVIGEPCILRMTSKRLLSPSNDDFFREHMQDFDLLRFLLKKEIKSVFATGSQVVARDNSQRVTDTIVLTLQMHGGGLCVMNNAPDLDAAFDQTIEVLGTDDAARVACNKDGFKVNRLRVAPNRSIHLTSIQYYQQASIEQFRSFAQSIQRGQPPTVTLNDALPALLASIAARTSYQQHRIVNIEEVACTLQYQKSILPTVSVIS